MYMKDWRFKEIKQYIPSVMKDESSKGVDAWWEFSKRVCQFNEIRKSRLKSSSVIVLDESMSAFVPR